MSDSTAIACLRDAAYLVARGVRPAASAAIVQRDLERAREVAAGCGVGFLDFPLAEGWREVWVYREPHLRYVIIQTERKPATAYEHWVLGKLFGYSEDAIAGFLTRQGLLADLDELGMGAVGARGQRVGVVVQRQGLQAVFAHVRALPGLLSGLRHVAHLLSRSRGHGVAETVALGSDRGRS